MNRAVFLDRDGTINLEKQYLHRPDQFVFVPGAPEAIRRAFGASKKAFKQALGTLYKARRIRFARPGIELLDNSTWSPGNQLLRFCRGHFWQLFPHLLKGTRIRLS